MVEPFPWSDAFAVGDESLDADHRRMVGLINEICISVIAGRGDGRASLLRELLVVSEAHFRNEEALLMRIASEIDQHHLHTTMLVAIGAQTREHGRRLEALREIVERSRIANARADELKRCAELKGWFIEHAIGYEAQVKTILQSSRHLRRAS